MSEDAFIDHILSLKKQVSEYGQEVERLGGEIAKRDAEIERLRAERRERIATAFMAAFLPQKGWDYLSPNHAAKDALRYADALIEEIDKEATP